MLLIEVAMVNPAGEPSYTIEGLGAKAQHPSLPGKSNNALAKELKPFRPTALDWRQRFAEGGIKARLARAELPAAWPRQAAEVMARTQAAPPPAHPLELPPDD